MRILFFGTYDPRGHPRVLTLREGLTELGHDVIECNVPLDFDTEARVRAVRHPARVPLFVLRVAAAWLRLGRLARRYRDVDAVLVPYLGHFDVHLARRLWPRKRIALDHFLFGRDTAVDRGVTSPRLLALLDRVDRAAARAADIVFVDTTGHRALLPEDVREKAVVVPIGAPADWFRPPEPTSSEALRVVFFGSFTPLQGAPVVGRAIGGFAGDGDAVRFTVVGRGQDLELTRRLAAGNAAVTWHDWLEPEELLSLVSSHDVCLGIFGTGAKALRVVPNKVVQGAAAGCAIVTSDTQAQRDALGDAAVFVAPGDAEALAQALRELAADGDRVWALREAAHRRATEAFRPAGLVAPLHERLLTSSVRFGK